MSVFCSAEFNFTRPRFHLYLYFIAYKENKEIMNSNEEIHCFIVYSFMSPNCSSVGCPAVALVKEKLSVQLFEGCQSSGSLAMPCGS